MQQFAVYSVGHVHLILKSATVAVQIMCERVAESAKMDSEVVQKRIKSVIVTLVQSSHMREVGITQWIAEQLVHHTCPRYGKLISWYDMESHICK